MDNGWSQIDVQLRRRVRPDPQPRRDGEGLRHARAGALRAGDRGAGAVAIGATGVAAQADAENQVTAGLRQLMAVVEDYPDLKANQNFLALQEELIGTESKIAYARQFYNDQVMRLNTLIQSFPSLDRRARVRLRGAGVLRDRRPGARARARSTSPSRVRADRVEQAQDRDPVRAGRSCSWRRSATRSATLGQRPGGAGDRAGRRRRDVGRRPTSTAIGSCSRRPAQGGTAEEEPRLHNIVEGLAIAAGVPEAADLHRARERAERVRDRAGPGALHVAVTQGLLEMMNRVELEGVIGHEMAHVLDRDILVGTVVATLVGAAVLLSEFFMRIVVVGRVPRPAGQRHAAAGRLRVDLRRRVRADDRWRRSPARSSSCRSRATASSSPTRRARCSRAIRRA